MLDFIARAVLLVPQVIPHLKAGFFKSYDYMLATLEQMVTKVYNGNMGGDFVDVMQSLITGQMTQAFRQAWEDDGNTDFNLPPYLQDALEQTITEQADFDLIYGYYQDVIDARVDKTPIDPLLTRAELWANRYNEAYSQAVLLIEKESGGKMVWLLGKTEQHCSTCKDLNGIIAYATEWDESGVQPQNAPNDMLACGGWRCDCSLIPTTERKTPNALDKIRKVIGR